jgi:hypothetical protein
MLEEHQSLHSLQEIDLEVREAKLVEEHARNLHSFDCQDLSVELEELCTCVAGVDVTPTFYKNKNFVHIGVHIKMHIKL